MGSHNLQVTSYLLLDERKNMTFPTVLESDITVFCKKELSGRISMIFIIKQSILYVYVFELFSLIKKHQRKETLIFTECLTRISL